MPKPSSVEAIEGKGTHFNNSPDIELQEGSRNIVLLGPTDKNVLVRLSVPGDKDNSMSVSLNSQSRAELIATALSEKPSTAVNSPKIMRLEKTGSKIITLSGKPGTLVHVVNPNATDADSQMTLRFNDKGSAELVATTSIQNDPKTELHKAWDTVMTPQVLAALSILAEEDPAFGEAVNLVEHKKLAREFDNLSQHRSNVIGKINTLVEHSGSVNTSLKDFRIQGDEYIATFTVVTNGNTDKVLAYLSNGAVLMRGISAERTGSTLVVKISKNTIDSDEALKITLVSYKKNKKNKSRKFASETYTLHAPKSPKYTKYETDGGTEAQREKGIALAQIAAGEGTPYNLRDFAIGTYPEEGDDRLIVAGENRVSTLSDVVVAVAVTADTAPTPLTVEYFSGSNKVGHSLQVSTAKYGGQAVAIVRMPEEIRALFRKELTKHKNSIIVLVTQGERKVGHLFTVNSHHE